MEFFFGYLENLTSYFLDFKLNIVNSLIVKWTIKILRLALSVDHDVCT